MDRLEEEESFKYTDAGCRYCWIDLLSQSFSPKILPSENFTPCNTFLTFPKVSRFVKVYNYEKKYLEIPHTGTQIKWKKGIIIIKAEIQ